ncbi:MAG: transporter substrate-binding domain-containing protein [Geminicoccaceae bacterium]
MAGLSAAGLVQAADVRIATEGAYPPWNSVDTAGNLIGFEIELANNLCERMGVECEIVAQDWDGIIPALTAGKYDVIMAGMSITEEREEVISFTQAYANTPVSFGTMESTDLAGLALDIETINFAEVDEAEQAAIDAISAALAGKTVGVQTATTHENLVTSVFANADVRSYDTQDNMALDLASGRVDAIVSELSFIEDYQARAGEGAGMVAFGPPLYGGVLGRGVGAGLRHEDTELRAQLSEAIAAAIADGTVKTLSEQWFGYDVTPK